jgi:hypothetical protein
MRRASRGFARQRGAVTRRRARAVIRYRMPFESSFTTENFPQ